MAAICSRIVLNSTRRNISTSSVRYCQGMGDPIDHATGIEKRERLARAAGNDDPFDTKIIKRTKGTKDEPTLVPSAFDARIIGCVCNENQTVIQWMWLHQGPARRCECGYWFKLVEKAPF